MIDYRVLARKGKISFTEAYAKAHNALVELAKTPNPTNEDFNAFDCLEKQIKIIKADIAEDSMERDGYIINTQTRMWEKSINSN